MIFSDNGGETHTAQGLRGEWAAVHYSQHPDACDRKNPQDVTYGFGVIEEDARRDVMRQLEAACNETAQD